MRQPTARCTIYTAPGCVNCFSPLRKGIDGLDHVVARCDVDRTRKAAVPVPVVSLWRSYRLRGKPIRAPVCCISAGHWQDGWLCPASVRVWSGRG